MAKIMVNFQKRLKGASVAADFWRGENIDHDKKKAPILQNLHLGSGAPLLYYESRYARLEHTE